MLSSLLAFPDVTALFHVWVLIRVQIEQVLQPVPQGSLCRYAPTAVLQLEWFLVRRTLTTREKSKQLLH